MSSGYTLTPEEQKRLSLFMRLYRGNPGEALGMDAAVLNRARKGLVLAEEAATKILAGVSQWEESRKVKK